MGSVISKLSLIRCICRKSNKHCPSREHYCICFKLLKCSHGIKQFVRCSEKGKYCVDYNNREIKCLSRNHSKRVPEDFFCDDHL